MKHQDAQLARTISAGRKAEWSTRPSYRYPAAPARVEYEPLTPRSVRFDRANVDWTALDSDDRFPNE